METNTKVDLNDHVVEALRLDSAYPITRSFAGPWLTQLARHATRKLPPQS